tara:strand:+ start:9561 stop:9944 length:384 start_codon:yes stop_codon:yes gene_type:complete
MGRYYNGDIEGKFWFAVQSSDAPSRFGRNYSEPNYVDYYFEKEDLKGIMSEIQRIKNTLGDYKKAFDEFFDNNNGYNTEKLEKFFKKKKMDTSKIKKMLEEYADLGLGRKIEKCVKDNNECNFQAEL